MNIAKEVKRVVMLQKKEYRRLTAREVWNDFGAINKLVLSINRWYYENKVSIALSNKILKQYRYHANILDHYGNCIIKLNEIIDSYERIEKMRNDEHK